MDEDPLAADVLRARDERVMCSHERFGHTAHLDEVEAVRHAGAVDRRNPHELGLRATPDDAEHPVAELEPRGIASSRVDDTRELEPGNVGRCAGRRRIATRALHQIGAVQARALHSHDHFTRARFGIRPRGDDKRAIRDRHRSHRRQPTRTTVTP